MTIPDTNITLEALLDQIPMDVQFVDKDGFLRYMNKVAAARPANCKREIGVNIRDCHAKPESLQMVDRIMEDFKKGQKEPHYYVSKTVAITYFHMEHAYPGHEIISEMGM